MECWQYRVLLFFKLLLFSTLSFAQPVVQLTSSNKQGIKIYAILADKGYTIQQMVNDHSLPFIVNGSLQPHRNGSYWIRIKLSNPSQYAEQYQLWLHPQVNNTLYYFNADTRKWAEERAGLTVRQNKRLTGYMPFVLQGNAITTLYIKADVSLLQKFNVALKPDISVKKQNYFNEHENFIGMVWIGCLLLIAAFLLYHTYLFIHLKDKIYLYYIIIQLGGIVYVTTFRDFFNQLLSFRWVKLLLTDNGNLYYYDFNTVLLRISIIAVMYGFVQLARTYLNTKEQLPRLDKLLLVAIYVYVAQSVFCNAVMLSGVFYIDYYTIFYENILVLCLMILILFIAFAAMRNGIAAAKYFLLANIFPLGLMIALAVYFAVFRFNSSNTELLPYIAVVSQAVAFAVAIVWRVNLIKKELYHTQSEINILQVQYEQLVLRNQQIEIENRAITNEMVLHINLKDKLQYKLETNQRELASNSMYIMQKNELMTGLQKQINQLAQQQTDNVHLQVIKEMKSTLQNGVLLDNNWEKFKLHFEQVHPNFFVELEHQSPHLTAYEVRLCAYLHLKMSAKEIAALLNIDANSVHRAKTRLKKKMQKP